jgi:hypothetical protein
MQLRFRTVQIGSPRQPGEGLRIGAVRFVPRGVRKSEYGERDLFDLWLPLLAPSRKFVDAVSRWNCVANQVLPAMPRRNGQDRPVASHPVTRRPGTADAGFRGLLRRRRVLLPSLGAGKADW